MHSPIADDALTPWLTRLPASLARALVRSPRAAQLARDGAHLVRALTDKPRTSRTFGGGVAARASADVRLTVLEVRPETDEAVTLVLERPAGLSYLAGQFLTFHLATGQGPVRRSYSLSSSPSDDGPLSITVKRVPRGAGSTHLTTRARVGDVLLARGPQGSFVLRDEHDARHLVLVAGGSGVTPVRSIVREALRRQPARSVSLVFANQTPSAAIFVAELEALVDAHPGLELSLFFERDLAHAPRPRERVAVCEGRLDDGALARAELARAVRRGGDDCEVFVCGPPPMMEHVRREVLALGVPEARVHQERFGSPRAHTLTGGPTRTLTVGARSLAVLGGETLLEASARAGVALDSSCTMGGCGACRMKLVSGEVELEEPNCLSDDERRQGLVLTCIARPTSDVVLAPLALG